MSVGALRVALVRRGVKPDSCMSTSDGARALPQSCEIVQAIATPEMSPEGNARDGASGMAAARRHRDRRELGVEVNGHGHSTQALRGRTAIGREFCGALPEFISQKVLPHLGSRAPALPPSAFPAA